MGRLSTPIGTIFGRLTVLSDNATFVHGSYCIPCLCDCGKVCWTTRSLLHRKLAVSCGGKGCKNKCKTPKKSTEYNSWRGMIDRCLNEDNKDYPRYGKRGITVCSRWNSFENFLSDMGRKPHPHLSLDRINNEGNYCPENCRWTDATTQSNNRRSSVKLTWKGKTLSLAEWSRVVGIGTTTLYYRYAKGLSTELILGNYDGRKTSTKPDDTTRSKTPFKVA